MDDKSISISVGEKTLCQVQTVAVLIQFIVVSKCITTSGLMVVMMIIYVRPSRCTN